MTPWQPSGPPGTTSSLQSRPRSNMAHDPRPVLLSAQALADGRVAYVWSITPGWRVTIVSPSGPAAPGVIDTMASVIIPAIAARKEHLT